MQLYKDFRVYYFQLSVLPTPFVRLSQVFTKYVATQYGVLTLLEVKSFGW